jgi:predicted nucleotide-binding protein
MAVRSNKDNGKIRNQGRSQDAQYQCLYILGRAKATLDNPTNKPTATINIYLDVFIFYPSFPYVKQF